MKGTAMNKLITILAQDYAKTFRRSALLEIANWADIADKALTDEANKLPMTETDRRFSLRSDAQKFSKLFYAIHDVLPPE
jgi:hypothetical protein